MLSSQVTIGVDDAPLPGALLDIKTIANPTNTNATSTKGVGLPRVMLTDLNELYPMFSSSDPDYVANKVSYKTQHKGLTVYNMSTTAPFNVTGQGLYIWDGDQWSKLPESVFTVSEGGGNTSSGNGMDPVSLDDGRNLPNCYIVAPNNTVGFSFPIQKPFKFWKNYKSPANAAFQFNNGTNIDLVSLTGTATANILWTDVSGLISSITITNGKDELGYITIKTANATGNAIIDFKIGTTTYWSWHIWVTAYDPNTTNFTLTNTTTENKYVFMDRNLGATTNTINAVTTMGLLYQWGRKDPFPGAASTTGTGEKSIYLAGTGTATTTAITSKIVATTTANNLVNSINNPMVFYTVGVSSTGDWYTNQASTNVNGDRVSVQNDELWIQNGAKTPFDPCPQGWHVPYYKNNISPWFYLNANGQTTPSLYGAGAAGAGTTTDFTNDVGWRFTTNANYRIGYYPATGFRQNGSGKITYTGQYGYIWTASPYPSSINACYVSFNTNIFNPLANTLRANGMSIRCVAD